MHDEYCGYPTGDCLIYQSRPRAVVALSEDQQWLVVLTQSWSVYHWWDEDGYEGWTWDRESRSLPNDTGQSADDVLRIFLRERGA